MSAAVAQAAPPANDDFAGAVALGSPPSQVTGTNIEATTQPNEPSDHGDQSVWWKWTADQSGRFRVEACETLPSADLSVAVYTGAAVAALTNVTVASTRGSGDPLDYSTGACADGGLPAAVFDATAGETYFVAIGASSCCTPTSSNIVLKLSKSAVNDNLAEATAIAAVPAEVTGSNVFASVEQFEPDQHGPASIWWRWTADQSGRFRADACATLPSADLMMSVYTGASVAALTDVSAASNRGSAPLDYGSAACEDNGLPSLVFDAVAGQTYYFAVGAASCCTATSPNIVFKLAKSAVNDNFAEALMLAGAPHARATGSNVFASLEQSEPDDHGDASIWWKWTAPQTGPYTVHTCNTLPDADSLVRIYTGAAVNGLAAVEAEYAGCAQKSGTVGRFEATAGQTYYIAVGASSCCTPTSPGIVLTVRDSDCDAANRKLRKAQKKAKKAKRALKRAKQKGRGVKKAKNRKSKATRAVKRARGTQGKRC